MTAVRKRRRFSSLFHKLQIIASILLGCLVASEASYAESRRELTRLFSETRSGLENLRQAEITRIEQGLLQKSDGSQLIEQAMDLAEHYSRKNPILAKQYLSLAEGHLLFHTERDPALALRLKLLHLRHSTPSELISTKGIKKLLSTTHLNWQQSRYLSEILLERLSAKHQPREYIKIYESYEREVPDFLLQGHLLQSAVAAYDKLGHERKVRKTLEKLASRYPLSPESKWAFDQLLIKGQAEHNPYAFTLSFLRNIHLNTSIQPQAREKILEALHSPVRVHRRALARRLPKVDILKFLIRLREYSEGEQLAQKMVAEETHPEKQIEAQLWLAHLNGKNNHFLQAVRAYKDLYAKHPNSFDEFFLESYAENQMKSGMFMQAASTYQKLRRKRDHYRSRWYAFWNYKKAGNYEKAAALLSGRRSLFHPRRRDHDARLFWSQRLGISLGIKIDESLDDSTYSGPKGPFYRALTKARFYEARPQLDRIKARNIALQEDIDDQLLAMQSEVVWNQFPQQQLASAIHFPRYAASQNTVLSAPQKTTRPSPLKKRRTELVYENEVFLIAEKLEIDPLLIYSIIRAESGFNPVAMSSVGARGIMQIMPYTALKIADYLNDQDFQLEMLADPVQSILYGAVYLKMLMNLFDSNIILAIAAYNAGPHNVSQWLDSCQQCDIVDYIERIPFRETRLYVKKVVSFFANYKNQIDNEDSFYRLPEIPVVDPKDLRQAF